MPGGGKTYFLATNGGENETCQKDKPCREVVHIVKKLQPGDVVRIAHGNYKGFDLIELKGRPEAPITFLGEKGKVFFDVTTDRKSANENRDTIFVSQSTHIILDGLSTKFAERAGVRVDRSDFITVRNGSFVNSIAWGIFTNFSDDLLIESNVASGSKEQHGIYVSNSSQRPTVRNNVIFGNANCGLHMNADLSMGPPGLIKGAVVEGNLIYDNGRTGGAGINMDGVQDSLIVNNVLYDNHGTGIVGFKQDAAAGPSGLKMINNTVIQAENGRHSMQIVQASGRNMIRNNILLHLSPKKLGLNFGQKSDYELVDSDYNIVDRIGISDSPTPLSEWRRLARQEQHSLAAPSTSDLFLHPDTFDFTLLANSPAKRKGVSLTEVAIDFSKKCRKSPPSIGAFD